MNGALRILGIDPGLRRTGWGVIEVLGNRLVHVACGSLTTDDKARRFRRHLPPEQQGICLANGALIAAPLLATLPSRIGSAPAPRTWVSTTEPLDRVYRPAFPVAGRYASCFQPTFLTGPDGALSDAIREDVLAGRPRARHPLSAPVVLRSASGA